MRFILAVLLLMTACTEEERVVALADLDHVDLLIYTKLAGGFVGLELTRRDTPCAIVRPDFVPLIETPTTDVPFEVRSNGGVTQGDESGDCDRITFHIAGAPVTDPATLVLEDPSKRYDIDLGGMLLPQGATLIPAGPWNLAANHSYSAAWSQRATLNAASLQVELRITGGATRIIPATVVNDTIGFATPDLPSSGTGVLTISVGARQIQPWPCPPATWSCAFFFEHAPLEIPVTFIP